MRRICLLATVGFLMATALGAEQDKATAPGLSKEEAGQGFVSIFDGKSLDGWKGATDGYAAENGLLVCQKKGGNLFTVKEFGDFVFRFEFKLEPGGNNGVSVRGHEIQILDDYAPQHANIKPCQYHGSIYCKVPAKRGATKKAGEWNTQEIAVKGSQWKVTVNGEVIVDADIAKVEGLEAVAKRAKAPLGFLGHSSRVEFRNLRVKEEQPGWVNLLEGGDLTKQWTTKGNWKLADGVVSLEPRPGEQGWARFDAYLWAKKEYKDFEIEFDYKVQKGGNSGFYFHVGDVNSPVAKGIEVQIYDSGGKPKDAKLTDHDSGGIIPGIPPTKNAAKAAGEWNQFRVTCQGNKVTIVLNGEVVNEVPLDHANIKNRPPTGAIGFQDHALPLSLRNIRIREPGK
jgi:hypothetical protein